MYALTKGRIYSGYSYWDKYAVLIEGKYIRDVVPENTIPAGTKCHTVSGAIIAPGLIDIQLNGCGGVQFNETLDVLSVTTLEKNAKS